MAFQFDLKGASPELAASPANAQQGASQAAAITAQQGNMLGDPLNDASKAIAAMAAQRDLQRSGAMLQMAQLEREYALRSDLNEAEWGHRRELQEMEDASAFSRAMQIQEMENMGRVAVESLKQRNAADQKQRQQSQMATAFDTVGQQLGHFPEHTATAAGAALPQGFTDDDIASFVGQNPAFAGDDKKQSRAQMVAMLRNPVKKRMVPQGARTSLISELVRQGVDAEQAPKIVDEMLKDTWSSESQATEEMFGRFQDIMKRVDTMPQPAAKDAKPQTITDVLTQGFEHGRGRPLSSMPPDMKQQLMLRVDQELDTDPEYRQLFDPVAASIDPNWQIEAAAKAGRMRQEKLQQLAIGWVPDGAGSAQAAPAPQQGFDTAGMQRALGGAGAQLVPSDKAAPEIRSEWAMKVAERWKADPSLATDPDRAMRLITEISRNYGIDPTKLSDADKDALQALIDGR